jgi:tetratricopeptide (TPR) repeat protein
MKNSENIVMKATGSMRDWLIGGILGIFAMALYYFGIAPFVYPGESAHVTAVWMNLDNASVYPYPLAAIFYRMFGVSNALSPILGALAVAFSYRLMAAFLRLRSHGEYTEKHINSGAVIAGAVTSLVFLITPSVRSAATHIEPALFDGVWALGMFLLALPALAAPKALFVLIVMAIGAMAGFGAVDTPLFIALAPLWIGVVWGVSRARNSSAGFSGAMVILAVVVAVAAFLSFALSSGGDQLGQVLLSIAKAFRKYWQIDGWLFVAVFATLPFITAIFSSRKAFNEEGSFTQWAFHIAMTCAAVISVATPLAPWSVCGKSGVLPIASSFFAAALAGYVASFWWMSMKARYRTNESLAQKAVAAKSNVIGKIALSIFSVVLVLSLALNAFTFDSSKGDFADAVAKKIIESLGERKWIVSDGTLDDHIRICAHKMKRDINLVCLNRDLDTRHIDELTVKVSEENLGGERNSDLILSLSLGVVPFVQDFVRYDADIAQKAVIYGAPDLWYNSTLKLNKSVPEFIFFGADSSQKVDWKAEWNGIKDILSAPAKWGSYRLYLEKDPVTRLKYNIRRHLGMVAVDRAVYLQDNGKTDEAFDLYELVLNEIDRDNVCALFNEFELARLGYKKAVDRSRELERSLKSIVADKDRRYVLERLSVHYGYIRNPDIFVRLGFAWARSGRPGEALGQFKRAIDFMPADKRMSVLNMMAALYASDNDIARGRKTYEEVLEKDANNHDALIGMMRLELMDGNSEKAIEYLEKATVVSKGSRAADLEFAMLHMMRNELDKARARLKKVTDKDVGNLQAWSLTAAVVIQQLDAASDKKTTDSLMKELEDIIIPTMEKQSAGKLDYHLQTVKAFALMRKDGDRRREARDAFLSAARVRPDISATQDIVLGLDISLNDTENAERHAIDVLRRNREAPLANYVMGSLALQRGEDDKAEAYLRKAATARKPVPLALNDLAEVLRRKDKLKEAELFARKAVEAAPKLYVAWETLGSIILSAKGDLDEAEKCISKALELSKTKDGKEGDVRMLISLVRVQLAKGEKISAKGNIRKIQSRIQELSHFERSEFEEIRERAK